MMLYTFDVIALDADTQDASHLIELMLDLRHAKNTLLLLFPIERFEIWTTSNLVSPTMYDYVVKH